MILKPEKIQLEYSDNEGYFKDNSFEMKSDDEQYIVWVDIEIYSKQTYTKKATHDHPAESDWTTPEIIINAIDVMDIHVGEVISRMDLKAMVIENLIID